MSTIFFAGGELFSVDPCSLVANDQLGLAGGRLVKELDEKNRLFVAWLKGYVANHGRGVQTALAIEAGISQSYLSEIISKDKVPLEETRLKIIAAAGATEAEVLGGRQPNTRRDIDVKNPYADDLVFSALAEAAMARYPGIRPLLIGSPPDHELPDTVQVFDRRDRTLASGATFAVDLGRGPEAQRIVKAGKAWHIDRGGNLEPAPKGRKWVLGRLKYTWRGEVEE